MDINILTSTPDYASAFNTIAHKAIPLMAQDAYFCDLNYDVARLLSLEPGERFFLLIRKHGTSIFASAKDAIDHCNPKICDGVAVLCVERLKYDFRATVLHKA